jgi:hypothetical protein
MGCSHSGYAETLAVNLEKQKRLHDRDIKRLQLTEAEVTVLFEAFSNMDSSGEGVVGVSKWLLWLDVNPVEQREKERKEKLEKEKAAAKKAAQDLKDQAAKKDKKAKVGLSPAEVEEQKKKEAAAAKALLEAQQADAIRSTQPRGKYARRLFYLFSRTGKTDCDFGEFLVSCVEYLSPLPWSLIHFAFFLYDTDGSGAISLKPGDTGGSGKPWPLSDSDSTKAAELHAQEVLLLAKEVLLAAGKELRVLSQPMLAKVETDIANLQRSFFAAPEVPLKFGLPKSYSTIDENEFAKFALKNPAILYAAYRLREALILRIGGGPQLFYDYTARRLALTKLGPATLKAAKETINLVPSSIESIKNKTNVRSAGVQSYPQDLIPQTTNRLAGTLTMKGHERFSEDFAPEADVVYAKLIFTDIFGKITEMRRRAVDGTSALQSLGSSRSVLKSQPSVRKIQGTGGSVKTTPPMTPTGSQKAMPLTKQASRKVLPQS